MSEKDSERVHGKGINMKKVGVIGIVVVLIASVGILGYMFRDEERDETGTGSDPHTWTSLRNAEKMIDHFVEEIGEIDEQNADYYEDNAEDYTSELRKLDQELEKNIPEGEAFMIYHPSMGYFADDYGLEQMAIEVDGDDPGPGQIRGLIDRAEDEDVEVIFTSPQFDEEAAQTIADEIDGSVETIDPLAKDYLDNMRDISESLIGAIEGSPSSIERLSSSEEELTVAVTIPPQIEWVEEVGGNRIETVEMVPHGEDPHTYEPEPSRMEKLSDADAYFKLGSGIEFEERHMDAIKNQNPDMEIIDGGKNIELRDFDTEHEHDHEYDPENFEIIDRDTGDDVAYVHGDHWHGSLPEVDEGEQVSLGAYIEDEDGNKIELGDNYQLGVNHALDADKSVVSFNEHGDHVHIHGEEEGNTKVAFQLIHDDDIVYETPPIDVYVGEHDHEDEIGEFEIIDRETDDVIAYVHGDHWHDAPLEMHEGEHLSLGAYIEDDHGHEIELGEEEEYQLGVSLADRTDDIVSFHEHGDHVYIEGEEEGSTEIVFELIHHDHVDYVTPPLDLGVI